MTRKIMKISNRPSLEAIEEYKVRISLKAFHKMMLYVDLSSDEVSWMGTVTVENGAFFIGDVFLVEQENSPATTEMTENGLADLARELLRMENGKEYWNQIRMWGHSHVSMNTGPSFTDDDQLKEFTESFPGQFFIRLIANKFGDMNFTLCLPFGVKIERLPWSIWDPIPEEMMEEIRNDLLDKVKSRPVVYHYGYHSNNYYNNNKNFEKEKKREDLSEDYPCLSCSRPETECRFCKDWEYFDESFAQI